MLLQHKEFELFADYRQFYLWDAGMNPVRGIRYTDADVQSRIKAGCTWL